MGFGRPVSRAILGEPLRVSVPIRLESGETLDTECVSAQVHYGDTRLSSSQVQVSVTGGHAREATVQVRTTVPISEPIVTYDLIAGCQAKINRQFVALADPPGLSQSFSPVTPPVSGNAPAPTQESSPRTVAPAVTTATPDASPSAVVRPDQRTRQRVQRSAAVARGTPQAPAARQVTKADEAPSSRASLSLTQKAAASPAGRLELDPVEADAAVRPDLRMSGSLSAQGSADDAVSPEVQQRRAAAAALWQAMNLSPEDVARDRQKLLAQERMLAQLQVQASQAATANAASTPGAQPPALQGGRSWLLYGVGALALAGLGLCVALFLQLRRRQQAEAAWWQSQMQDPVVEAPQSAEVAEAAQEGPTSAAPASSPSPQPDATPPRSDIERASSLFTPAATSAPAVETVPVAAAVPPLRQPAREPVREPMREVSVEELIDLEQQAEFFIVLGQDDAAVDLLESHVNAVSASPLPFLKLLEIYQRLGRHTDYERVQAAFNQRFNAHAPAWEADLQRGRELADYPWVVERLQALWSAPAEAMEVLEKSLTRPESEADTFELPAYRELLFLYAVARDLSERELGERPRVDLLASAPGSHADTVPFDLSAHDSVVEPLMATRPIKAIAAAQPTLSLDLHLDDLAPVDKPRSSYGDVTVPSGSTKRAAANEQEVEHIDLPGLSELDLEPRGAHKP